MNDEKISLPRRVLSYVVGLFTRNWALKLLCLVLAVALWAGLISQDESLTREKIFTDATITVNGEDNLLRNSGFVVISGLEAENLTVRLRVNVPQGQYASATVSNYNPRIDLTRITGAGEQQVKVLTTSTTTYGTVTSVSPETITVVVDEYVTNYRIPVVVNVSGSYPTGWSGTTPSSDVNYVAVSGPKTLVEQVSRVQVEYSLETLSYKYGTQRTALSFAFLDAEGNPVESDLLQASTNNVTLRSLVVSQTLYPLTLLTLDTSALWTGTPAEGYQVTGVEISPQTIQVGGSQEAVELVGSLFTDSPVDVTGAKATFSQNVKIRKPSDLNYLSTDTVTVTVTLEPILGTKTFTGVKINLIGSTGKTSLSPKTCTLDVVGPVNELSGLKSGKLSVYADVSGLEAGTYDITLYAVAEGYENGLFTFTMHPEETSVTIAEK